MDGRSHEAFLAKAKEAEQIALDMRDQASRENWLALAKGWRDLAAQLARLSQNQPQ